MPIHIPNTFFINSSFVKCLSNNQVLASIMLVNSSLIAGDIHVKGILVQNTHLPICSSCTSQEVETLSMCSLPANSTWNKQPHKYPGAKPHGILQITSLNLYQPKFLASPRITKIREIQSGNNEGTSDYCLSKALIISIFQRLISLPTELLSRLLGISHVFNLVRPYEQILYLYCEVLSRYNK